MRLSDIRTAREVEIEIPREFSRLRELAYNLWWSWSPRAQRLFHDIDVQQWSHYHNPVELLINVKPRRWQALLRNAGFVAAYRSVTEEFGRYLSGAEHSWFRQAYPDYQDGSIAYFSTEYGWHECLQIYSGGLGVLSGDHCKSASDLGLPFVGVGLMYRRGYFRQTIDPDGHQQHTYPDYDLSRLPLRTVIGGDGIELRVPVDFPGRQIRLRVWKADVGRVPVLLLDSDIEENVPADRMITSILYVRGREMRLCQEILLGIGGVRTLKRLGISPSVWHINEGHSSLLSLQRIRDLVERQKVPFAEALRRTAGNAIFTTHTPVPVGNESFDAPLVRKYLEDWTAASGIDIEELLALGRAYADRDTDQFNLTALAIRTSSQTNAVSELHGRVASEMWKHLWKPKQDGAQVVGHVTNGVHIPTWLGPEMGQVLAKHLGQDLVLHLQDPGLGDAVRRIPDVEIWSAHQAQKLRLLKFARERVLEQFARYGKSPDELRDVEKLFDSEALTVGFARRFATYKRADLIFRDPARLRSILSGLGGPVQILFAGKAHPADRAGQELVRRISEMSHTPDFLGRVVFLENYNMRIGRCLVQGVDLWLNNPRRPQEASGTSGMKVAMNSGLNCSILDGWWCEGYDPSHGWAVGEARDYQDADQQDDEDAVSLYDVLAEEIVPCYYRRDESGLPREWIARVKTAMATLIPRFSTARMVREYTDKYYVPYSRRQG